MQEVFKNSRKKEESNKFIVVFLSVKGKFYHVLFPYKKNIIRILLMLVTLYYEGDLFCATNNKNAF